MCLIRQLNVGNLDRTEALIDASRHQWTYRAGVISFAGKGAYSTIQACYQMLPSDGLQTVEPFRKGSETVSKQETKVDDIKENYKTLNGDVSRKVTIHSRPTASVLNSAIAREARGKKS